MAIQRPTEAVTRHLLTAYDFEWKKKANGKLEIIVCGAYDERGYRWYPSLALFVRGELVAGNANRRYYAHFGGASDMVFLLRELLKDKSLSIRGLFSSSSAIVVSVDKGADRWTFLDSFWTMRTSLATIGTKLGYPKVDWDHTKEHTFAKWRDYNEVDCKLLYFALTQFQEAINDLGGELRVTGASTALDLFQRRYLERAITTSRETDEYARPSYIASRVERFQSSCEAAKVYDINSSFPYSFTKGVPGDQLRVFDGRLPDAPEESLWIADCDVRVPNQYIPPLPVRGPDGRIYFPTGTFRARITSEDYLCGDFLIEKVHSSRSFERRFDMAEFAFDLYAKRQLGGFEAEVYKIVLNSLYGKFAERADKQVLLVNPRERPDPMVAMAIAPHVYLVDESVNVEHSHVAISSLITARSRRLLREAAQAAYKAGNIYYCDTDSVICDAELPTSKALGGLKLECEVTRGTFQGAKLYAYEKKDGRQVVKAKGFSRIVSEGGEGQRLTFEDFARLREGQGVTVERMRRIREHLREAGRRAQADDSDELEYEPDVVLVQKMLRAPRPKRAELPDGNSRPWRYDEITEE